MLIERGTYPMDSHGNTLPNSVKRVWEKYENEIEFVYFNRYNNIHNSNYYEFFWIFTSMVCKSFKADLFNLSKEWVKLLVYMSGLNNSKLDNYSLVELDIPEEYVLETDLCEYTKAIFTHYDSILDIKLPDPHKDSKDTLGIVPFISEKWIVNVKKLSEIISKECFK